MWVKVRDFERQLETGPAEMWTTESRETRLLRLVSIAATAEDSASGLTLKRTMCSMIWLGEVEAEDDILTEKVERGENRKGVSRRKKTAERR